MPLVFLPQILWHSKDNKQCDRVYSLDFQPQPVDPQSGSSRAFKLATGGADEFVHIWQVAIHDAAPQYATHSDKSILAPENLAVRPGTADGSVDQTLQPFTVKIVARLVGHIGEVNAVRWNPNGIVLASGGEDRCIFLWAKSEKGGNLIEGAAQDFEEHYSRFQYYRLSNVVNSLSWCPQGRLLAVSTEDGHISLIDTFVEGTGKIRHFEGHTSFAQGVAMCPKNTLLASMGQDQTLRIWKRRNEKQWKNILVLRSAKNQSDFKESIGMESDDVRYSRSVFMSEELSTFFRRLDWSPDGRFLVAPAGIRHDSLFRREEEIQTKSEPSYTLYVFHRKLIHLGLPMVTHESPTGPFVVVKFCSLDLSKIEKEKINFFNKLFHPKGRPKRGKKGKSTKVATSTAASTGTAEPTENKPIKSEGLKGEPNNLEATIAVEPSTKAEGDEPASNIATASTTMSKEASVTTEQSGGPIDSTSGAQSITHYDDGAGMDMCEVVKVEGQGELPGAEATSQAEHSEVPDIDLSAAVISEKIDCDSITERSTDVMGADEGKIGVRTSKREIKRPDFYEADIGLYKELNRPSKSKSAKKDEDREYDTDAEDEVVVPRLMFAAGTLDGSLCFYDTMENRGPIAVLKNLHYCAITDIAWSPDGLVCATASSDGYITFVVFQKKEFY